MANHRGFTLIELLVVVTVIGILAAIAIPNLLVSLNRTRYVRAASDTKTAVSQGIVYSNDINANPGTVKQLRASGYANIGDNDPWGKAWVYSAAYADTTTPATQGEMGVCSKGVKNAGNCTWPLTGPVTPAVDGDVGYSSVYGSWQGLL